GNAGRGVVFPYRLARSNGPHDYVSFSQNNWKGNRNVVTQDSLSTGITGFSVTTNDSNPSVGISLRNNEGIDYRFNKVQVIYKPDSAVMTASDSSEIIETVNPIELSAGINEFRFSNYLTNCKIKINSDTAFTLFGLNLMNDSSGVIYHTIGVNGAEYNSFLRQPLFFEQVKTLNADLYILSFGTNEAFAKNFDGTIFIQTVDSFITKLRNVSPSASILITSPPESCKRIRRGVYVPNPNVITIRNLLQKYCIENKIAFFDLYEYSGGKGSMLRFAKSKMSDARRIHLNRSGYEMQGLMLLQALLKPLTEQ
ncbi:MAG TPA: GDSL-type esterase/lipase family protein, partial [Bacteroidia bacterium]|nr:GDSL-type esterase/lipase family protein [Bacteroidia bacterium]